MMLTSSLRLWAFLLIVSGTNMMGEQARVRVFVSDALGNPVPARIIAMIGAQSATEMHQGSEVVLDYGEYTLNVEVLGFEHATRSVTIDQPEQIVTIAMKLGAMEGVINPCSIIGRVEPANDIARIRLIQLFGAYLTDVPVKDDGSFQFRNLSCGAYMVIAMSARGCVGIQMATARVLAERFEMKIDTTKGTNCRPANE